jgi:spore maturation protein CgeB
MRLTKVSTVYPEYVRSFYAERPNLVDRSYAEQREALAYDSFGWADFWAHALAPLGYEVQEVWANVAPLQEAWARENRSDPSSTDWIYSVALEQIAAHRPDVLFMDDYTTFSAQWIAEARARAPSVKLVIGWCGAPFRDSSVFAAYDVVLSNIPELVTWFSSAGHKARHVNHAFDPRVLDRIDIRHRPDINVSFVGQIERSANAHGARERTLATVAAGTDLQLFSPARPGSVTSIAKTTVGRTLYAAVRASRFIGVENAFSRVPVIGRVTAWRTAPPWPLRGPLNRALRPPVFGLRMFDTLRRSHVTLNSHIDLSTSSATNMRMFEATGVGACLVTDEKENLASLFQPGAEVVSYRSAEDCLDKVRWLLAHPQERDRIALAGQRRTLRDHTFARRAPLLDEVVRAALR